MILQIIAAFFATLSFSVLFNVDKKDLVLCGLTGSVGWLFYNIALENNLSIISSTFVFSVIITSMSRFLANIRKTPITVFLISGIIPLVPGAGVYYTMYNILNGQNSDAMLKGIETLKIAGAIAIGIIVILSLPIKFFTLPKIKKINK